jgi:hypothetical protein
MAAVLLALVQAFGQAFHSSWDLLLGQLVDHLRGVFGATEVPAIEEGSWLEVARDQWRNSEL